MGKLPTPPYVVEIRENLFKCKEQNGGWLTFDAIDDAVNSVLKENDHAEELIKRDEFDIFRIRADRIAENMGFRISKTNFSQTDMNRNRKIKIIGTLHDCDENSLYIYG